MARTDNADAALDDKSTLNLSKDDYLFLKSIRYAVDGLLYFFQAAAARHAYNNIIVIFGFRDQGGVHRPNANGTRIKTDNETSALANKFSHHPVLIIAVIRIVPEP